MIVGMKKVSIVMKTSWMDEVLSTLRELGAVHLKPVKPVENSTLSKLKAKIRLLEQVIPIIPDRFKNRLPVFPHKDEGFGYAEKVLGLLEEAKHLKEEIGELETEYKRAKVWGKFNPEEVDRLRDAGIFIKLFRCNKRELSAITKKYSIIIIARDGSAVYFALVSTEKYLDIPLEETPLPLHGLDSIGNMTGEKRKLLHNIDNQLCHLYENTPDMKALLKSFKERLHYEEARAGLGRDEDLSYLVGFCPVPSIEGLKKVAGKNAWAILIEEPSRDEQVPTLLRHSKWSGIFQPVMDFVGVIPGYREFDTNGIFLIFFSIFFAMIMGDGGYGVVLLMGTFMVQNRYKHVSHEMILLFYLISVTTIIWGAITGFWFGLEALSHLPVLKEMIIPSLYSFSRESGQTVMHLCIFIGAIQLTVARVYAARKQYPSLTLFAEAGWAALIWGIYFIARYLLLSENLNTIVFILAGFWFAMMILFGEQKNDGFVKGVLRGGANLLITIVAGIGSFSDLISYIRLFAVGLATKEISLAFNNMAGDIGTSGIFPVMFVVIILVFGHTLNILLGAMSVLVHGIRLNLLEFSKHLSVQWSGIKYKPFKIDRG
ncbi:MAG: hypothetical protein MRK01_01245 [Candidatus Scalindua sp.]|nr:hypothetical protein [Candidatus Scalindua sp.]